MGTSADKVAPPGAVRVRFSGSAFDVELDDGRILSVPLAWYPRLQQGSASERANWRLIGNGHGIHWPALDEDISVEALLGGTPSGESPDSLDEWRRQR